MAIWLAYYVDLYYHSCYICTCSTRQTLWRLAIEWMSGEAMRSQIAVDALRKEIYGRHASPLFEVLYPMTGIFMFTGVMSMILELGAPLALINKKMGMIWSVLTCGMHWGIYFIMGIHFPYHIGGFIFLSFFPLENVWFWAKDRIGISKGGNLQKASNVK